MVMVAGFFVTFGMRLDCIRAESCSEAVFDISLDAGRPIEMCLTKVQAKQVKHSLFSSE